MHKILLDMPGECRGKERFLWLPIVPAAGDKRERTETCSAKRGEFW